MEYSGNYKGFDIFINTNADSYRKGFTWEIVKDDQCIKTGLNYTVELAIHDAQEFINDEGF